MTDKVILFDPDTVKDQARKSLIERAEEIGIMAFEGIEYDTRFKDDFVIVTANPDAVKQARQDNMIVAEYGGNCPKTSLHGIMELERVSAIAQGALTSKIRSMMFTY